jgi:hypothetical protein
VRARLWRVDGYLMRRTGSPTIVASQVVMSLTSLPEGNVTVTVYQHSSGLLMTQRHP